MFCVNIIKGFYNWATQLLRNPTALDHSIFDSGDAAVTLLRIVVTGIDDNHIIRNVSKQIARQIWNVFHWNGDNYDLTTPRCLIDCDRRGAGLFRKSGESFG